ncbi:rod shape-determining protein MreD [Emcibacter sp. SYSU 3D8]|uniref:rod shape-determining protein MreD n=1 Tax=Emcibacter sp. SYSU 3D8 TaxID=3133969 RepID=UPI0031FEB7EB
MTATLQRAIVAIRTGVPFVLGMLLAVLSFVPYGSPEFSVIMPSLTLPLVYYWTLYRPEAMPLAAAFAIGLWQDILVGGPLGLMALLLVVTRGVIENQRQVLLTQPFAVGWLGFALISAALTMLAWMLAGLWWNHWFSVWPFIAHWGLGTAAYVPLAIGFRQVDKLMYEHA